MSRYSPELACELAESILAGVPQRLSAEMLGIAEETLTRWKKRKEFREAIRNAEQRVVLEHVNNVRAAGKKWWQASAWWLERTRPEYFALRPPDPISGNVLIQIIAPGGTKPTEIAVSAARQSLPATPQKATDIP